MKYFRLDQIQSTLDTLVSQKKISQNDDDTIYGTISSDVEIGLIPSPVSINDIIEFLDQLSLAGEISIGTADTVQAAFAAE